MTDEIEDEEMTLEEIVDKKMLDCDMEAVEKMYSVACRCLSRGKNRRPVLNEVGFSTTINKTFRTGKNVLNSVSISNTHTHTHLWDNDLINLSGFWSVEEN